MHLDTPTHFSLDATARNSWLRELGPLSYDPQERSLRIVLQGPATPGAIDLTLREAAPGGPLRVSGLDPDDGPGLGAGAVVLARLRDMLRLDEDLSFLYHLTDQDQELRWVRRRGAGRLLRSPTAYEDLVKALIVGKIAMEKARRLIALLCQELGPLSPSGRRAFPLAPAMAEAPLSFYERLCAGADADRLARPLKVMAARCLEGGFYPESLRRPPRSVPGAWLDELDDEGYRDLMELEMDWEDRLESLLLSFPGFGMRAVELMMPLLGCYDGFLMDRRVQNAWRRRLRGSSEQEAHRQLLARVAPFGHFRGLALWLLTKESETSARLGLRQPRPPRSFEIPRT